jgi:hypothetical protein
MTPTPRPATITADGSLVYLCDCGVQHWHGSADHKLGDRVGRASHCPRSAGENVELVIVADERDQAAA